MHWLKISLSLLILIICYEFFCRFYPWPLDGVGHTTQVINQIKMEELHFNWNKCHSLIVGTSLSHSKPRPFRPPHCDMALIGGDIIKQLKWIDGHDTLPPIIYIEGSAFFRQNTALTWSEPLPLSSYLYSIRTKYQLPNIILASINKFKGDNHILPEGSNQSNAGIQQMKSDWLSSPIFERQKLIADLAEKLRSRGADIQFYFFPVSALATDQNYQQIILEMKNELSHRQFKLNDQYSKELSTADGLHPLPSSAFNFFYWLLSDQWATKYHFSTDWFTPHRQAFEKYLAPFRKQPINYLEVGVYEGRSFFWVVDHILKHPSSKAWALDFFPDDLLAIFNKNRSLCSTPKKVEILRGDSSELLTKLQKDFFELIYLDGSHVGRDVLRDLIHLFDLLKYNGIMLIDDYALLQDTLPAHLAPQPAVDAFLKLFVENIEILYWGGETKRPLIIRKRKGPCDLYKIEYQHKDNFFNMCSNLSEIFAFDWSKNQLLDRQGKTILTSSKKVEGIKRYLLNRTFRQDDEANSMIKLMSH